MGEPNAIIKQQETCISINQQRQPEATNYNHPCGDLLEGRRRKHYKVICVPLYNATLSGNWEAARAIFERKFINVGDLDVNPKDLVRYSITENKDTPLHVAVRTRNTEFVRQLLRMMKDDDLKLQNEEGNTAFCIAAMSGNVEMTQDMIKKNREILTIRGSGNMMPLYLAASYGKNEMVQDLYKDCKGMKTDIWTDDDRIEVFLACISTDIFGVALEILNDNEKMGFLQDKHIGDALHQLALKPYAFLERKHSFITRLFIRFRNPLFGSTISPELREAARNLLKKLSTKIADKPKNEIDVILRGPVIKLNGKDTYASPTLFAAASMGNTIFLVELLRENPDLIWKINEDGHTIFHIAVLYHNEDIFNLFDEIGSMRDTITQLIDKDGNNMLHLAATNTKSDQFQYAPGAGSKMQRASSWYKEVGCMVLPRFRDMKNKKGLTPHELFTENHQKLAAEGETWIKGTVNQSMVAAALIATIGFSVVFSVPGGFDQNNGLPIFLRNKNFTAFVILDAISFILSSTSILTYLSLMISKYDEDDYLESLPRKLLLGQTTLFLSIFTIMAAFSTSLFVTYNNSLTIIISVLVGIPVLFCFCYQSVTLLIAISYVYGSRNLFNPKKRMLYYQNPTF